MGIITYTDPLIHLERGVKIATGQNGERHFETYFQDKPDARLWGTTLATYETMGEAIQGHMKWIRLLKMDFDHLDHFRAEYELLVPANKWSYEAQEWCATELTEQPCIIKSAFTGKFACFSDKDAAFHFKMRWL